MFSAITLPDRKTKPTLPPNLQLGQCGIRHEIGNFNRGACPARYDFDQFIDCAHSAGAQLKRLVLSSAALVPGALIGPLLAFIDNCYDKLVTLDELAAHFDTCLERARPGVDPFEPLDRIALEYCKAINFPTTGLTVATIPEQIKRCQASLVEPLVRLAELLSAAKVGETSADERAQLVMQLQQLITSESAAPLKIAPPLS